MIKNIFRRILPVTLLAGAMVLILSPSPSLNTEDPEDCVYNRDGSCCICFWEDPVFCMETYDPFYNGNGHHPEEFCSSGPEGVCPDYHNCTISPS